MNQAPSRSARTALLQVLLVAVLLLPVLAAAAWLWQKHTWAQEQLQQLAPRHARLLGLADSEAKLAQASATIQAQLQRHAYPATQDALQAGNDAQQRIRTLFADSKLDIGSIQVLPPKEQKLVDRIPLVLRVEGDLVGLQNALALLEAQTPTVWVEGFSVQTVGAVKPKVAPRLAAQLTMHVLRLRS